MGAQRKKIGNMRAIDGSFFPQKPERLRLLVTKTKEFFQPFVASEMQDSRLGEVPMIDSTQTQSPLTELATRARAEFREMPGMCLTTAQAARLWQLSPARAEELLSELVQAGFLVRRDGQRYRLPSAV